MRSMAAQVESKPFRGANDGTKTVAGPGTLGKTKQVCSYSVDFMCHDMVKEEDRARWGM